MAKEKLKFFKKFAACEINVDLIIVSDKTNNLKVRTASTGQVFNISGATDS